MKDLLDADLNKPAIYQNLMSMYHLTLEQSLQTLHAGLLDQAEKEILGYDPATEVPCVRQQNVIHSTDHTPIFVFHATFPGDRFRFTVRSGAYQPELL